MCLLSIVLVWNLFLRICILVNATSSITTNTTKGDPAEQDTGWI